MKVIKHCMLFVVLLFHFDAVAQINDLNSFLARVKTYTEKSKPKIRWSMQVVSPGSSAAAMPNAIKEPESYMEDTATGLRFYPQESIIFDPKTGYSINYDPEKEYFVDFEKRKIFQGKTEIKIERQKR